MITMPCPTTVHENVCIGAQITINPLIDVGDIITTCTGDAFIGTCPGIPVPFCSFMVSQSICVQVPLIFHASVEATPVGITCGGPSTGGCPSSIACTRSIGYYWNNPEITNGLIAEAGGSIILGTDGDGLSFTVTTSNAADVLELNTPSPPAPSTSPFAAQYQLLYAQLLAANLNVLSGATCDAATMAIMLANTFIASSPPGGMANAPAIQALLAQYNNGLAPGCPGFCG
jgi:hypothetical protein